jgi:ketosteroid isomerase-like protein
MSELNVEFVLKGYRAFVDGDFERIAEMLDPEIEWNGLESDLFPAADREEVLEVLASRFQDGYRLELERCVGVEDQVVVAFRAAGVEKDATDDRPLQTRRYFTVGRYFAVVTIRDGRVVRVQDHPHLSAALEAVGLEDD